MSTPYRATDLLAELPRLRRYARVLTGDPDLADSLVEEALLRFRRDAAESLQSACSLELMALLRAVTAEKALPGAQPARSSPGSSRPAKWIQPQGMSARSLPDRAVEMLAQVSELPLEHREVLLLVAVERLSYGDIATLLRIPVAAVVSRLTEARQALHAAMAKSRSAPNASG